MADVGAAREPVVERLRAAGCVAAEEEAAELVEAAADDGTLEAWVRRREQGEPLPWITGRVRFCGHTIRVDPSVFVPRQHSEELARRAAAVLPSNGAALDLCTGSGAVAVHLRASVPTATVIGVDLDLRAAACARRNGVDVVVGDLDQPVRPATFDVVTAVAPYIPTGTLSFLPRDVQRYEPRLALDGGADGLDVVRRIVAAAALALRPDGWLFIEVGGDQEQPLGPFLTACGYHPATPWFDGDGDLRGLAAQRLLPPAR